MNIIAAAKTDSNPFKQIDLDRVRQRGWWIILLLAIGTIVLSTLVRSWADCQFFYQAELEYYLAHPGEFGRPPQPASAPIITKLMRMVGQLLNTAAAWIGWTGGLYLIGLLLGQRDIRFGTVLKIVAWSWLPFIIRGLAQCAYMWLTKDPIFNPGLSGLIRDNTPPPPGGGYHYIMPTKGQLIGSALLAPLDAYLFWHLGLIVGGLKTHAGYPIRKALLVSVIVGLTLLFIGLLPTIFGNALGQFRLF